MLSYLIGEIPWWVPWAAALLGAGALFYFFSPVLVPLWNMTPRPVKIAIGAVLAGLTAYQAGRNKGTKDAKDLQAKNDAAAVEHRSEIDTSVHNASDADLDKRADRWMRD